MALVNERLRAACARLGVDCLSLDDLNGIEEVFYDDCHFTERGAVDVADRIAAWFATRRETLHW